MRKPRIVYVQYTNPAGYPSLEHSSRILADRGFDVLFLGAAAHGADTLEFPPHSSIRVRRMPSFGAGVLQKLNYLAFCAWTLVVCMAWRPRWVYASDPMTTLPALAIRALIDCRILYHEHDTPNYNDDLRFFQQLFQKTRRRLADKADICVLPQKERLREFIVETERKGPTLCVWNCPRRDEVLPPRRLATAKDGRVGFYYHGSLNRERLPLTVLDALSRASPAATLTIVGYETIGSNGYVGELMAHAERLGMTDRVRYLGVLSRSNVLAEAARADIGLALIPVDTGNINMAHMVGASVKPFDYMAAGLMLLVSDLPEWKKTFVEPGYAQACNPDDIDSLTAAMAWCTANPERVRELGEAGRQRIGSEWHYERQFETIVNFLVDLESEKVEASPECP